jgi:heme A synthase
LTQSILILQPTHTPEQKRQGTAIHFTINFFGASSLFAGLAVILYAKLAHHGTHLDSPHAVLGLVSYVFLLLQGAVGFTQYYTPQLYGGVDKAKKLYKYHRMSGYVLLVLLLATVVAATKTYYINDGKKIKLWAVLVPALLVLVGVLPRIKKQKLGIRG